MSSQTSMLLRQKLRPTGRDGGPGGEVGRAWVWELRTCLPGPVMPFVSYAMTTFVPLLGLCSSSLEYKLHESRDFACCVVIPEPPEWCLARSRCSINSGGKSVLNL